jgi:hypothetical protein
VNRQQTGASAAEAGNDEAPATGRRRRVALYVALSIMAGAVVGYGFGQSAGVRSAVEAGARVDAASLAAALPWKPEIASQSAERQQIARLLEEVRVNRAQIEAMRHATEHLRAGERLRALETARDAAVEGARAQDRAAAQLSSELARVGERVERLEKRAADMTPTASIPAPERKRVDGKPRS